MKRSLSRMKHPPQNNIFYDKDIVINNGNILWIQFCDYFFFLTSMFKYVRDIYTRHKKKFLITSGVAVVSYLIGIYIKNKIKDFQDQLKEENATRELIKKRFSQTQKDCYMTFLSFLPVLIDPIYKELNVEDITKELKLIRNKRNLSDNRSDNNSTDLGSAVTTSETSNDFHLINDVNSSSTDTNTKSNIKSKVELWKELKTKSLTRFLTLVYSETLLILLLHLQLNIISRKSYLKTAIKLASRNQGIQLIDLDEEKENDGNNEKDLPEQAFLSFTWWLLNKGWANLNKTITESVEVVFNEVNLREELTMEKFSNLIVEVQKSIDIKLFQTKYEYELYENVNEKENENKQTLLITSLLLPSSNDEFELLKRTNTVEFLASFNSNITNMETLQRMNSELKGYLDSEMISNVTRNIVSSGISSILDSLYHSLMNKRSLKEQDSNEPNSWKLAFILAVLTPQTQELINRRIDNPVLQAMNNVPGLDELSASVYSNFEL